MQKDEVVLSANVHNYLKTAKKVDVTLALQGGTLAALGELTQHTHCRRQRRAACQLTMKMSERGRRRHLS